MKTFDCLIDTDPLAATVSSVSTHVQNTTVAVAAMEAAVIESEKLAADKICHNVTSGFHVLITSQVSQKAAGYFSQMSSKMILLVEFAKTLATMQNRMNNDYQRLKREYMKIFRGLDKSLENRIRQLDKKVMEIADVKKSVVISKIVRDAPSAMFYGKDTQNTAQLMFSARIRSKTCKALDNIAKNVFSYQYYKKQLDSVLNTVHISQDRTECIPVIFTEEKSFVSAANTVNNVYVAEGVGNISKNNIASTIMQNITQKGIQNMADNKSESENSEIKNEFMNLISASNLDERTATQMIALFNGGEQ